MIILSGASACGKTEVAKYLSTHYGFKRVITTTTREMRIHEKNNVDYYFVSKEKFKSMVADNCFVEYMEYNGNFYGSTIDEIQDNKILVCDSNGVKAYRKMNNPRIVIFILETDEDVRYNRMLSRGDLESSAKERLIQDKITFSDKELGKVDLRVNTTKSTIEEVAKQIFDTYNEKLKK